MADPNFISQQDALELIGRDDVSFVDGSWYLPAQKRNAAEEFQQMRIPGAVYFDIDAISDRTSSLPHMLPHPDEFAKAVSLLGISHEDLIIIYDGPGMFSSARVWWTFKIMGALDVRILKGGLDGWKRAELPLETGNPNPPRAHIFKSNFDPSRVYSRQQLEQAVESGEAEVLDARPEGRFTGDVAEPRPGLRSGHIPGSLNLPVSAIVKDGELIETEALDRLFNSIGIAKDQRVITTCGSGVTAAILSLALTETGRENHALYDGSWSEWGLPDGPAIEKDAG